MTLEDYHYIMVLETGLVLAMILGAYYGRTLEMTKHHILSYGAVIIQLGVFVFYMGPNWLNAWERGFISNLMILHGILGLTTLILSVILLLYFLFKRNEFDLKSLRYTRPLMIAVLTLWILTYLIGAYFFITVRL